MTIFSLVIGGLFIIGLGIALYEWRAKTVLLKHDMRLRAQGEISPQHPPAGIRSAPESHMH